MILRLLGVVYAFAFLAAALQLVPLMGAHGLTPLDLMIRHYAAYFGSVGGAFTRAPSLFWFWHTDAALLIVSWAGFALACAVVLGFANSVALLVLWALYMSIVHTGQIWYGYGWETQLLETGFLAVFLCPLLDPRPFGRRPPPTPVIWLFRWLIFRIMLGSGLIKLRGDPAWRDLTALFYHFETQPIPNGLSRWFDFLPHGVLRGGVVFNHLAELAAPFFVFGPRLARRIAGGVIVLFQVVLILSGNLSFLNWLTIVPALACFDDDLWARIVPRCLARRAERAAADASPSMSGIYASWALALAVALLSVAPVLNLLSPRQIMNTSFSYDPLDLVNTYGAFGSVTRERMTVVFQGTDSDSPHGGGAEWRDYPYLAQPVDVNRRPRQVAPYQPRLDWQMWFAAMGPPNRNYAWTLNLIWKLLHNDPGTLSLFGGNPFPDRPPRYIRAVLFRYRFAPPDDPQRRWWIREPVEIWLRPLSVDTPELQADLRSYGWLPPQDPVR